MNSSQDNIVTALVMLIVIVGFGMFYLSGQMRDISRHAESMSKRAEEISKHLLEMKVEQSIQGERQKSGSGLHPGDITRPGYKPRGLGSPPPADLPATKTYSESEDDQP